MRKFSFGYSASDSAAQRPSPRFMGAPPLWPLPEAAAGAQDPSACLRGKSCWAARDAADTGNGRGTHKTGGRGGGGGLFGHTRLGSNCPARIDLGHEDRMDRIWESFNEEPRRGISCDKLRGAKEPDCAQRSDRALQVCYGDGEVVIRRSKGGRESQVDRSGRQSLEVMLKLLKRMVLVQKSNSIGKVSAKVIKIGTTK